MKYINDLEKETQDYISIKRLAIFPLVAGGKTPITKNGFHDATKDLATFREIGGKNNTYNIGIPTGAKNGLVILDFDVKNSGMKKLFFIKALFPILDSCPRVKTGGGGEHIYLKFSPDLGLKNKSGVLDGVDVRTEGGYVVAPPSVHANGNMYQWINNLSNELLEFPERLLFILKDKSSKDYIRSIQSGERNQALFNLLMYLRRVEIVNNDSIMSILCAANEYLCDEPLNNDELGKIENSLKNYDTTQTTIPISKKESNLILSIFLELGTLFHYRGAAYIKLDHGKKGACLPSLVHSRAVSLKIHQMFYKKYKKPVSDSAIKEASQVIEAMAIHEADTEEVFIRVAADHEKRYIDLLDDELMVEVTNAE